MLLNNKYNIILMHTQKTQSTVHVVYIYIYIYIYTYTVMEDAPPLVRALI